MGGKGRGRTEQEAKMMEDKIQGDTLGCSSQFESSIS